MDKQSRDPMDKLLKEAYPEVEVSQDFKLRLWRGLMDRPAAELWKVPVPALAAALLVGILGGVWTWQQGAAENPALTRIARVERLDLFGNAPQDSLAGVVLRQMKGVNT